MKNCEIIDDLYYFIDKEWEDSSKKRIEFFEKLRNNKNICLFGAGGMGKDLAKYFLEIGFSVDFFCDNNPDLHGKEIYKGIKCISFDELLKYKNDVFIIISTRIYLDIDNQLTINNFSNYSTIPTSLILKCKRYLDTIDKKFLKSRILELFKVLEDNTSKRIISQIIKSWFISIEDSRNYTYQNINLGTQYFPEDIIELSKDEIFIDVGAYNGDTVEQFLKECEGEFKKIIAYELDATCFDDLSRNIRLKEIELQQKIKIYNLGLYSENRIIQYSSNRTSSSITENADVKGEVVRISDHLEGKPITMIKMDIEGAEIEALKGAEEIVKTNKPKMAICIYHEPYHFWEIPLYIKKLVPEYKLYIRHHSNYNVDTVCYAVNEKI